MGTKLSKLDIMCIAWVVLTTIFFVIGFGGYVLDLLGIFP